MRVWLLIWLMVAGPVAAQSLTIATTGTFPPYLFEDGDRPSGFDIDLMDEICAIHRFDCAYVIYPLREGLEAVANGHADIALGGIGATVEREVYGSFTCPYRTSGSSSTPIFARDPDTDLSAARIAVMADTQSHAALVAAGYDAVPFVDLESAIRSVLEGDTDAYHGNTNSLPLVPGAADQLTIVGHIEDETGGGVAFLVSRSNPRLLAILNDSLGMLARDGQLQDIADIWFGEGGFAPPDDMSVTCGAMLARR